MSISHCRTRRRLVALAATATVATLAGLASPGLMAQGAFPSKAITMAVGITMPRQALPNASPMMQV